jgi:aspartate kinase
LIVMKFGGTSVEDGSAMKRVVEIIERATDRRPVVVVSAIAGATDRLLAAGRTALTGDSRAVERDLRELLDRHHEATSELDLPEPIERELIDALHRLGEEITNFTRGIALLRELTPRVQDAIVSYGERLSAQLLTAAARSRGLDAVRIDACDVVRTDARFGRARPDTEALRSSCRRRILPELEAGRVPILEGFVGATEEGETTTLGRGGSDYTAALVGAALEADEIQIWTDVDGMLTADHRVVPGAKKIRELAFAEAAELAYFGARVLHPATVEPAVSRDIPVLILNSRRPGAAGTRITSRARKSGVPVKSIAAKKGITVVDVRSLGMLMAHGFLGSMFEIFDRHEVPVDLVSTSEVSVSLTIDSTEKLSEIEEELSRFSEVTVERDCAIVCLVGEELRSTPGIAARCFGALGEINVRMISQGASERNLSIVLREEDADDAVKRLHEEFLAGIDRPDLFEAVETGAVP